MVMISNKPYHMSAADHDLVTQAVAKAELSTNGEIVTVVADCSGAYADIPVIWASFISFLALAIIALTPSTFTNLLDRIGGEWDNVWTASGYLAALFFALILIWLLTWALFSWRPLRYAAIPTYIKRARVRARAIDLFKVGTQSRTIAHTGILIFLSMREHRAEIVADAAIADVVAPEVWGDAMAVMITHVRDKQPGVGMAAAVEKVDIVLAEHFPKQDHNPNELPDRLIEI
jgi:putative membrane protein